MQSKIIKYLQANGAYVIKTIVTNRAGVPDIIACYKGVFIGIEKKEKNEKVSKLQEVNLEKIKQSGGYAIVAKDLEGVERLLKEIDRKIIAHKERNTNG